MNECEHDFQHESTHYESRESGYGIRRYARLDIYYCRKCLEKRLVEKQERANTDDIPLWWRHEGR
jgi:hypothetical protein